LRFLFRLATHTRRSCPAFFFGITSNGGSSRSPEEEEEQRRIIGNHLLIVTYGGPVGIQHPSLPYITKCGTVGVQDPASRNRILLAMLKGF
jgi:hypothetical protein